MSYEDNKKKNPVYITFVILNTGFNFILSSYNEKQTVTLI